MGIFRVDSPFYKFLVRFVDVVVLNFWLLVCSIPLVTAGAAITAAFSVTMKMVREEEGYITKSFFKAFKENFKQSTIVWLLTCVCAYIIYLDFEVFNAYENGPIILPIIGFLALAVLIASLLYVYPQIPRYQNSIKQMMKNSQQITIKYFGRTLGLFALLFVEWFLAIFSTTTLFFAILIGPVLVIYTISAFSLHIFDSIEKENKE